MIGGFATLVALLTRGEQRTARVVGSIAERLPAVHAGRATDVVHRLSERFDQVRSNPRLVMRASGWAAVHWIADAASLWVVLVAFGASPPLDVVIVAFGVGSMLATLPISPRGLGLFEAATITLLVAFGTPRAEAILGVIGYRLFNFWLPIPIGAASYLSVEASLSDKRRPVRDTLSELGDLVTDRIERFSTKMRERWAGDTDEG